MTNDKLSEVFDIEPLSEKPKTEIITKDGEIITPTDEAIGHDFEATRNNLHSILQQGQEALEHALAVAKQSEHPRAFEVVGGLMKHLSDINGQLLDLHKKKQAVENPRGAEPSESKNVTNNAIFVGSTNELSKMLSDLRKGK